MTYPDIDQAKELARQLRAELEQNNVSITHSQALEKIAHRFGYRDWNSFTAAKSGDIPDKYMTGQRVSGTYLSHRFSAIIKSARMVEPSWFQLDLAFDEPVDVIAFEAMSNKRQRVKALIGPKGHTKECTSDGKPHMVLD